MTGITLDNNQFVTDSGRSIKEDDSGREPQR